MDRVSDVTTTSKLPIDEGPVIKIDPHPTCAATSRNGRDRPLPGDYLVIATTTLTPDQRRIVEWGDGPVVVIAGAGTGKTRVIVERVRHLLDTRDGLLPENLLVLTYNVKAARELQERLDKTVGTATRAA